MMTKLHIIFYSMYGHTYQITEAMAAGVREMKQVEVELFRLPELISDDILEKTGAKAAQTKQAHIPILDSKQEMHADAYLFNVPFRYGNPCLQMRNFLQQLNTTWHKKQLIGKIAGIYTSHQSQSSSETNTHLLQTTLFDLGMMVIGMPAVEFSYSSLYGMANLTHHHKRMPSADELENARLQGKKMAAIAQALKQGKNRAA